MPYCRQAASQRGLSRPITKCGCAIRVSRPGPSRRANATGANETAATYNFCQCGKVATDSSCTTNQWRDLCMDPGYATAAGGSAGVCFGSLAVAVVAAVLSW